MAPSKAPAAVPASPLQEIVTNKLDAGTSGAATVKDPVLARALDMLKALAVVQSWKKEN